MAKVVIDQTERDRIEEIVSRFDPDSHPYTAHLVAELAADEWRFLRDGLVEEMRARLGLELIAQAAVEAAIAAKWAHPHGPDDDLVKEVRDSLGEYVYGAGRWTITGLERPDVDDLVDDCYDVIYLALAELRGEPAPNRIRQR